MTPIADPLRRRFLGASLAAAAVTQAGPSLAATPPTPPASFPPLRRVAAPTL